MRESNERVILSLLRRTAPLAKADIARRTGLSAQTVARLIGALEADGLIRRGKPQRGRIGQPSVPLSLNPAGAVFLGLKVGRRSVEMIAADFSGRILDREKRIYSYPDFQQVLGFTQDATTALRERLPAPERSRVAGLGIAMPFFLWNWAQHIGVPAALMADWKHRDLQAELAASLDLPVFLQNDASAACSAEIVFGKEPLPANALCFFIGFFVGGGLSLGHVLYTGSTGNAAGFAPLRVTDLNGDVRPLIELASLAALEKALIARGCDTVNMWIDPDGWDFPHEPLRDWVEEAGHALAQAIHAAQTILDLEAVLVDGWMPRAMLRDLTATVQRHLGTLDMTGIHSPVIRSGTVGGDARALGAASLPLSHRFLEG